MHEIAMTADGRPATAWVGLPPWHGLGTPMTGDESLQEWLQLSGMDWKANRYRLGFDPNNEIERIEEEGGVYAESGFNSIEEFNALVRSDTGGFLGMVSPRYNIVQPAEVMGFFGDLTESYGFKMETAGVLRGGRVIWALASTDLAISLEDVDEVKAYLLLSTSFDRSVATQAKFTSVRVVCNNTLTMSRSESSASSIVIPHSRKFDAKQAKIDLKIGEAWETFKAQMDAMVNTRVTEEMQAKYLLKVYHGLKEGDPVEKKHERTIQHMAKILRTAPGADMPTALGTVWGLLNAVTHDIDFDNGRRNLDTRLSEAWFGAGERLKNKAFSEAMELVTL